MKYSFSLIYNVKVLQFSSIKTFKCKGVLIQGLDAVMSGQHFVTKPFGLSLHLKIRKF